MRILVDGQEIGIGRFTFLCGKNEILKSRLMYAFLCMASGCRELLGEEIYCEGFDETSVCFVSADLDPLIGLEAQDVGGFYWVGKRGEYADSAYLSLSSRDRRRLLRLMSSVGIVDLDISLSGNGRDFLLLARDGKSREFVVGLVRPVRSLFVLGVQALIAPPGSVIAFEYPESGLHADVQVALLDFLVRVSLSRNVRVVLSTHSDVFNVRAASWVARGKLSPSDVLYYELAHYGMFF